jgi:hypothetical protein
MDEGFSAEVASLLTHIKEICTQMRDHEKAVVSLGIERRQTVSRLREQGVKWKTIVEWTGTPNLTQAALFKHQNRKSSD